MDVYIDGTQITTEMDLHRALSEQLDFGPFYGNNLAALWDRLTCDVERPVNIVWKDAQQSREALGGELFGRIVRLLRDVEMQDESFGRESRLTCAIEMHGDG